MYKSDLALNKLQYAIKPNQTKLYLSFSIYIYREREREREQNYIRRLFQVLLGSNA